MKPILHQAIVIQFKRSNLMLGLLTLISMLSCGVLLTLPISSWLKAVVILLVLTASVYIILRDVLLALPWSWRMLALDTKGQLTLTNQRGQALQPALADSTFIHSKLTILNFKREGFGLALPPVILIENSDEIRTLRVWLRWAKQPQNQGNLLAAD